jgi:hypothetical protein
MNSKIFSKKDSVFYWTSTGIVAAVMLMSALNFAFNPESTAAFKHLGLPEWFKWELTVAKLLGVVILVLSFSKPIKDFAYAGFTIVLLSAPIAHLSSGDSILLEIGHLFFLFCLVVSYRFYQKKLSASVQVVNS